MGAGGFHGRVRDGIGWSFLRIDHQTGQDQGWVVRSACLVLVRAAPDCPDTDHERRSSSIERLVLVSSAHCCACTSSLSTWSSSTALKGVLVSRWVSRLDAFSGYPGRT